MTKLYAWAIPANAIGKWADHTWVTTFDTRSAPYASLQDVAAAGEHLWMCWGSFHPKGGSPGHPDGLLAEGDGSLDFARCVVESNADSVRVKAARGTVQLYGIDGVCHQVSNQVLFATGMQGRTPISVKGSNGYPKSVCIYGQYGRRRNAWTAKVRHCGGASGAEDLLSNLDPVDDFELQARKVLADRAPLLDQLLALRAAYQLTLDGLADMPGLTAAYIDERHRAFLADVLTLVGRDAFVALYQQDPEDEMNLVDPKTFEDSRNPDTGNEA